MAEASAEWPAAGPDRLVVYLLGAGFGESQIVLFPDGRCLVVDSCIHFKKNLTAVVLRKLGVKRIDLFAVTHSDLDHLDGTPSLLDAFNPEHVMSYPYVAVLRSLCATWLREKPHHERLRELHETLNRLDGLAELDRMTQVSWESTPWPVVPGDYAVQPIAPSQVDAAACQLDLNRMITREEGKGWTVSAAGQRLLDGARSLGDRPNRLSIALSVTWRNRRVLLAGDVENGLASQRYSGWKGILAKLQKRKLSRLVSELDMVKAAHHGSSGAYHEAAWLLHAKPDGSTITAIAPFNRGHTPLPQSSTLESIRRHGAALGLTMDARSAFERARDSGWLPGAPDGLTMKALSSPGPVIAVTLHENGGAELFAGKAAAFFHR
ncbi:MAG: hypothetical protein R3B70_29235 [Polyangiaceae bacterium]